MRFRPCSASYALIQILSRWPVDQIQWPELNTHHTLKSKACMELGKSKSRLAVNGLGIAILTFRIRPTPPGLFLFSFIFLFI